MDCSSTNKVIDFLFSRPSSEEGKKKIIFIMPQVMEKGISTMLSDFNLDKMNTTWKLCFSRALMIHWIEGYRMNSQVVQG